MQFFPVSDKYYLDVVKLARCSVCFTFWRLSLRYFAETLWCCTCCPRIICAAVELSSQGCETYGMGIKPSAHFSEFLGGKVGHFVASKVNIGYRSFFVAVIWSGLVKELFLKLHT